MIELVLSLVTATHLWINGSNVLVNVCKYYSDYKVSKKYYRNPYRIVVGYGVQCPYKISVPR